jgi:hypothetical protein
MGDRLPEIRAARARISANEYWHLEPGSAAIRIPHGYDAHFAQNAPHWIDYLLDEIDRLNAEVTKYRRLYDIEAHGDRSK